MPIHENCVFFIPDEIERRGGVWSVPHWGAYFVQILFTRNSKNISCFSFRLQLLVRIRNKTLTFPIDCLRGCKLFLHWQNRTKFLEKLEILFTKFIFFLYTYKISRVVLKLSDVYVSRVNR